MQDWKNIDEIIDLAFSEDIRDGDHTTLSTVPDSKKGEAKLLVKEAGIIAGMELAKHIFERLDSDIVFNSFVKDGDRVEVGEVAFEINGPAQTILTGERVVLNFMQRMSGIATLSNEIVSSVSHTNVKILDTRKTTPGLRLLEKWAVKIGGAHNHRIGLFDMIMIKDNHVDFAGGVSQAVNAAKDYLTSKALDLKIEVEVRDFKELDEVLSCEGVDRVMLDNFPPNEIVKALELIKGRIETEASGGITRDNLVEYAETGVDFVSMGALTHSVKSLDLSLKAKF
jgi:nicotinate-nucleotide pyrophosphorylase (carboxylating)